jgi:hypothetical protein
LLCLLLQTRLPAIDHLLPFSPFFVSLCKWTFLISLPPPKQPWVPNPSVSPPISKQHIPCNPDLPFKNPVISLLEAQNFEYKLIWDCWCKIKSGFSYFSECHLVSHLTIFPQQTNLITHNTPVTGTV